VKYSQIVGIVTAIIVIVLCHFPWSIVVERNIVISGMNTKGTDFGRPGLLNIILSIASILLFSLPKVWAKRTNLFIGTIAFAWSIRNYILVTTCYLGECPQKQPALFALVFFSFMTMLMTFFPKLELKEE
jgi:hypothetical protein